MVLVKLELHQLHAKAGTAQQQLKQHFGGSERQGDLDRTGSQFEEEELVWEVAEEGISASDDDEDAKNGENIQSPSQVPQAQATTATFSNVAQQFISNVDNDEDEDDLELDAAGIQLQEQPLEYTAESE